jgi:cyclic dehypoxanthinyl futalosine synthase
MREQPVAPSPTGTRAELDGLKNSMRDGAEVAAILDRAAAGRRVDRRELQLLFDEAPLLELGQAAGAVRERLVDPATVTYIVDRNINYTNVCVYRCRFCAFYRTPADEDAYLLPLDVIIAKVAETVAAGGTGILLQGGVHPSLRLADYVGLLRALKEAFPNIHLHAFSVPEILFVAKVERMPVSEVLERLIAAGLDSIPGGGAEILEDDTRRRIWSRAKAPTADWLSVHRQAHELGLRTTATMMFGVGEPLSARVEHLLGVRGVQDATGGFTAFIPWTFQAANTDLEGEVEPSGGSDYLRTLAIARLALDNIVHLQGSWVTQGEKVGQLALAFGADDLGSIMLEENVVAAAGACHRMSQVDMERIIRGAGYAPRQRRTLYEPL